MCVWLTQIVSNVYTQLHKHRQVVTCYWRKPCNYFLVRMDMGTWHGRNRGEELRMVFCSHLINIETLLTAHVKLSAEFPPSLWLRRCVCAIRFFFVAVGQQSKTASDGWRSMRWYICSYTHECTAHTYIRCTTPEQRIHMSLSLDTNEIMEKCC